MQEWIYVGELADIPRQGARTVSAPSGEIAVFRTVDDRVFALRNRCPHRGGPLAEGIVHGHSVTCPLHNWVLDLSSGEAVAPDQGCAPRIEVERRDDAIWLLVDTGLKVVHG